MDKKEFLDILGQTLKGEVSADAIQQNINYYDQYISSQTAEEEAQVIDMLGDPRMIAKTVIETEKAAALKSGNHDGYSNNSGSGRYADDEDDIRQNKRSQRNNVFYTNLTWFQKLTLILVLIVFVFILIFVGRIIIGIIFAFGVPILLILLLYALFKKRN